MKQRLFDISGHFCNLKVVLDPSLLKLWQAFLHPLSLTHLIDITLGWSVFRFHNDAPIFLLACLLWTVSSHLTALTNRLCFILDCICICILICILICICNRFKEKISHGHLSRRLLLFHFPSEYRLAGSLLHQNHKEFLLTGFQKKFC